MDIFLQLKDTPVQISVPLIAAPVRSDPLAYVKVKK
jgi:hypothetical protein